MIIRRKMPRMTGRRSVGKTGVRMLQRSVAHARRMIISRMPAGPVPSAPPQESIGMDAGVPGTEAVQMPSTDYYSAPTFAPNPVQRSAAPAPAPRPAPAASSNDLRSSPTMPRDLQSIFNKHKSLGHISTESGEIQRMIDSQKASSRRSKEESTSRNQLQPRPGNVHFEPGVQRSDTLQGGEELPEMPAPKSRRVLSRFEYVNVNSPDHYPGPEAPRPGGESAPIQAARDTEMSIDEDDMPDALPGTFSLEDEDEPAENQNFPKAVESSASDPLSAPVQRSLADDDRTEIDFSAPTMPELAAPSAPLAAAIQRAEQIQRSLDDSASPISESHPQSESTPPVRRTEQYAEAIQRAEQIQSSPDYNDSSHEESAFPTEQYTAPESPRLYAPSQSSVQRTSDNNLIASSSVDEPEYTDSADFQAPPAAPRTPVQRSAQSIENPATPLQASTPAQPASASQSAPPIQRTPSETPATLPARRQESRQADAAARSPEPAITQPPARAESVQRHSAEESIPAQDELERPEDFEELTLYGPGSASNYSDTSADLPPLASPVQRAMHDDSDSAMQDFAAEPADFSGDVQRTISENYRSSAPSEFAPETADFASSRPSASPAEPPQRASQIQRSPDRAAQTESSEPPTTPSERQPSQPAAAVQRSTPPAESSSTPSPIRAETMPPAMQPAAYSPSAGDDYSGDWVEAETAAQLNTPADEISLYGKIQRTPEDDVAESTEVDSFTPDQDHFEANESPQRSATSTSPSVQRTSARTETSHTETPALTSSSRRMAISRSKPPVIQRLPEQNVIEDEATQTAEPASWPYAPSTPDMPAVASQSGLPVQRSIETPAMPPESIQPMLESPSALSARVQRIADSSPAPSQSGQYTPESIPAIPGTPASVAQNVPEFDYEPSLPTQSVDLAQALMGSGMLQRKADPSAPAMSTGSSATQIPAGPTPVLMPPIGRTRHTRTPAAPEEFSVQRTPSSEAQTAAFDVPEVQASRREPEQTPPSMSNVDDASLLKLLNLPPETLVQHDGPPMPSTTPAASGTVQRAETSSPATPAASSETGESGQEASPEEVEKMAQKVYRILQRRFRIEVERERGR